MGLEEAAVFAENETTILILWFLPHGAARSLQRAPYTHACWRHPTVISANSKGKNA